MDATLTHVTDAIPELILGGLPADMELAALTHLERCPDCAGALVDWATLLGTFRANVPPVPPRAELVAELMARLNGHLEVPQPLARWLDRLAGLLDLTYPQARALLCTLDDASSWQPMVLDSRGPTGVAIRTVKPGPKRAGQEACLLRLEPGHPLICSGPSRGQWVSSGPSRGQFPAHRHVGDERALVLQGGLREDDGTPHHAGELIHHRDGSVHSFEALPGETCIAAVLYGRIALL